jgi:hypothetical protein
MNLKSITRTALNALFGLGPDFVKDATYTRPASFSAATGLTFANETTALVKMLITAFQPRRFDFLTNDPTDERLLIRASDITGITQPAPGDYIIQSSDAQRRDVVSASLDLTAEFWTFRTARSLNQDWGDLTATTASEDFGDLTAITDSDDWGTLFP